MRNRSGALADIQAVLAREPENAKAFYILGLVREQEGRIPEAIELLTRAIELRSGGALFYRVRARLHHVAGAHALAQRDLDRALTRVPDDGMSYRNRALVRLALGDLDGAREDCQNAVWLLPNDPGAHFLLGSILGRQHRYEGSLRAYERGLKLNPRSSKNWGGDAQVLAGLGRHRDAIAATQKGIGQASGRERARLLRLLAWLKKADASGKPDAGK